MNYERQQAIFNSVEALSDELKQAVKAANHVQQVNSNAKNITDTIAKFDGLKQQVDKVIVDVNTASTFFSKKTYIALASALLVSTLLGIGGGYFVFIKTMQTSVLQAQINELTKAQLAFAEKNYYIQRAIDHGVKFSSSSVILPIQSDKIQRTEDGRAGYWYTN